MITVLDSNEYVFFLNREIQLPDALFKRADFSICIHKVIIDEVLHNISKGSQSYFYNFILKNNIKLSSDELSLSLLNKYGFIGLKKGDIVIASFCDFVNADYLITENRHFLKSFTFEKFRVINLKDFKSAFSRHN